MSALTLAACWNQGVGPGPEPFIQVHRASANTVILRQSLRVSDEAPVMYLLFGSHGALLLDSGATTDPATFPLRTTVDSLVDEWLLLNPRPRYHLTVAHTHAHGDHVAGDIQFDGRPDTTVVGHDPQSVAGFFGIERWPLGAGSLDLGDRTLEIVPIPGHEASSIAVLDPATRILFTGDTVYPGRLYVEDFPAFQDSLQRLRMLVAERTVEILLGAHIEMTTRPGRDFARGATRHPGEAPLPMTPRQLDAIAAAALRVVDRPGAHMFNDFAIWNGPSRPARLWHRIRLAAGRMRRR